MKAESRTAVVLEQSAKTVSTDFCGITVNAHSHSHSDHGKSVSSSGNVTNVKFKYWQQVCSYALY